MNFSHQMIYLIHSAKEMSGWQDSDTIQVLHYDTCTCKSYRVRRCAGTPRLMRKKQEERLGGNLRGKDIVCLSDLLIKKIQNEPSTNLSCIAGKIPRMLSHSLAPTSLFAFSASAAPLVFFARTPPPPLLAMPFFALTATLPPLTPPPPLLLIRVVVGII